MPETDLEDYARLAAKGLGFSLDEQSLRAVVLNLAILRAHAAEFADQELPMGLDPAAVLSL
jgi:hypothetical protein